jgi:hypothetical protein
MILREAVALTLPELIAGAILPLSFATFMKSLVYPLPAADLRSIARFC